MKKILVASDSFLPRWDGVSRFLYEVIPRLRDNFKITVLAPMFNGNPVPIRGVDVVRVPLTRMKAGDYQIPRLSPRVVSRAVSEADVVWTNTLGPISLGASFFAKLQHKPLLSYVHSIEWELFHLSIMNSKILRSIVYWITKLVAKIHYNLSDLLMVPSEEVGDKLTFSGIKSYKVAVKLGVDINNFKPPKNKMTAKKEIGLPSDSVVIGYCGRFAREKDLKTLRRAFNRLKMKRKECKLLLVGSGLQQIKDSFAKMKEAMLVGNTDEPEKYYQAMDIFVLPSLTETTGLTVLEAMSSQVAVVSTPVGISPAIIKDGENGYLFEMKSEYELYKRLDKLVSDRILREKIAKKGRELVVNNFSWDQTTKNINKILTRYTEE
jgi:glycosyltransferase involved in cell wall biosynthesis